jgi:hypothetical protein
MRADHYKTLAQEYQDEQKRIQLALSAIQKENKDRISNLDAALSIIAEIGERYGRQHPAQQREILRHMIRRVVVDEQGIIVRLEYLPPFDYLQGWIEEHGTGQQKTRLAPKNKQSTAEGGCSLQVSIGVPGGIRTPGPLLRRLHTTFAPNR